MITALCVSSETLRHIITVYVRTAHFHCPRAANGNVSARMVDVAWLDILYMVCTTKWWSGRPAVVNRYAFGTAGKGAKSGSHNGPELQDKVATAVHTTGYNIKSRVADQ